MRATAILLSSALALSAQVSAAQEGFAEHHLVVAANPILAVSERQVDAWLQTANAIMQRKDFAWDVSCPVRFVRSGSIVSNTSLPIDGDFDEMKRALEVHAPQANVLLAARISCSGIAGVAGCATVGSSPMVVVESPGFDGLLWAHERGHNVGLRHAPMTDASASQQIMYFQLGRDRLGLTQDQCSLLKQFPEAAIPAVGDDEVPLDSSDPQALESEPIHRTFLPTLVESGLTPAAYDVVAPPWVHEPPFEEIAALNDADMSSINRMFEGDPNPLWIRGLEVLKLRGDETSIPAITAAMEVPLAALPAEPEPEAATAYRTNLQILLAAPEALGAVSSRIDGEEGVSSLVQRLIAAQDADIPQAVRDSFQLEILKGLALNPNDVRVQEVLELSTRTPGTGAALPDNLPAITDVAPFLERQQLEALKQRAMSVEQMGLDATLSSQ